MAIHLGSYKGVPVTAFGHYVPADTGRMTQYSSLILDFKNGKDRAIRYFSNEIKRFLISRNALEYNLVFATVPSSEKGRAHKGFPALIKELAQHFNIENPKNNILLRTQSKQSAHLGGSRSIEENKRTLSVLMKHKNMQGKKVILLDDITTTGNSLKACVDLIIPTGCEIKFALVLGKTKR